jgi:hypothetical protein
MRKEIKTRLARLEAETPGMIEIVIEGELPEADRIPIATICGHKDRGEGCQIEGHPGESEAEFRARVRSSVSGQAVFVIFSGLLPPQPRKSAH